MNGNDPNRILNEIRAIDQSIDGIESDIERLKLMQDRSARDPNPVQTGIQQEVDRLSSKLIEKYQQMTHRVTRLKSDPESGNPRNGLQVGKVDRRLKRMIQAYQRADSDYRAKVKENIAREYRIVRPDASEAEVREATEDTSNTQVFSQAVGISYSAGSQVLILLAHQQRSSRPSSKGCIQRPDPTRSDSED